MTETQSTIIKNAFAYYEKLLNNGSTTPYNYFSTVMPKGDPMFEEKAVDAQ